jgi:hypothetical protein
MFFRNYYFRKDIMKTSRRKLALKPLSFSLYQRPLHPELFDIRRQFNIRSERFSVTLWITDQSHVLEVYSESIYVTELIATGTQPLPAGALLAKFQLPSQKQHSHIFRNNLKYSCDFALTKSSPALHKKQFAQLKRRRDNSSILIELPELSAPSQPAFTFLQTHATADQLHIHTLHSRPNRPELITTNTTIDLSQLR